MNKHWCRQNSISNDPNMPTYKNQRLKTNIKQKHKISPLAYMVLPSCSYLEAVSPYKPMGTVAPKFVVVFTASICVNKVVYI